MEDVASNQSEKHMELERLIPTRYLNISCLSTILKSTIKCLLLHVVSANMNMLHQVGPMCSFKGMIKTTAHHGAMPLPPVEGYYGHMTRHRVEKSGVSF